MPPDRGDLTVSWHLVKYLILHLSIFFSHSTLMSWLSNVILLACSTLPKDLVSDLVLNIGNSFLNLGILVPTEVNADADSVLEVKYCYKLPSF